MSSLVATVLVPVLGMQSPATTAQVPQPPVAAVVPTRLVHHGHVRIDDYYWLRERDDPAVIAHLEQENAYARAVMAHTAELQARLFEEMKGRMAKADASVPYRLDDHHYYWRYEEGREYPIHCRRTGSLDAAEQVLLDVNRLAEGHDFCSVQGVVPSPEHDRFAYAIDTVGRRKYTLRFVDLASGRELDDAIEGVTGNVVWAKDNETVFYTAKDPQTLRSDRVYRHRLGTDPKSDVLVYREDDETFSVHVSRTQSREYLLIGSRQTLRNEYRYLRADDPGGTWRVFTPREARHEHSIDHLGDRWYIRSNDGAENFRLLSAPAGDTRRQSWVEVVPHRDDVHLAGFELFRDHLVLAERKDGLMRLRVVPWEGEGEHYLEFDEPAYRAGLSLNPSPDTRVVRYTYTSLTTPTSTYDYDMVTREKVLLKRDEVLGAFDPADYVTDRLHARARDGASVPVSIVHRKGLTRNGENPLLLYGYGSYGATIDASFQSNRLSLLDRGFVFAIAHVRGGQMRGRSWYEDGKLHKKKNTFTDFIDVAEHLIELRYTSADRLFAQGGSAGGLLIGAVLNMRPDLFAGALAGVPFVDVVTTMLDDSIPLTTSEYDEWGDPRKKADFEYMLSYSPYDNVTAQRYPNLLVTTGLHDSQVQYWEPAKWVARLRASKTDDNLLLLDTDMGAGHGGASGRFDRLHRVALEYAFLLDLAGRAR